MCSLTLGRRCCVTESVGFTISIELASATSFHFEVLAGKIVGATGGGGSAAFAVVVAAPAVVDVEEGEDDDMTTTK